MNNVVENISTKNVSIKNILNKNEEGLTSIERPHKSVSLYSRLDNCNRWLITESAVAINALRDVLEMPFADFMFYHPIEYCGVMKIYTHHGPPYDDVSLGDVAAFFVKVSKMYGAPWQKPRQELEKCLSLPFMDAFEDLYSLKDLYKNYDLSGNYFYVDDAVKEKTSSAFARDCVARSPRQNFVNTTANLDEQFHACHRELMSYPYFQVPGRIPTAEGKSLYMLLEMVSLGDYKACLDFYEPKKLGRTHLVLNNLNQQGIRSDMPFFRMFPLYKFHREGCKDLFIANDPSYYICPLYLLPFGTIAMRKDIIRARLRDDKSHGKKPHDKKSKGNKLCDAKSHSDKLCDAQVNNPWLLSNLGGCNTYLPF